jgi:ketosteroid isomerase-like protein
MSEQTDRAEVRAHIDKLFRAFIEKDRETIRRGHTNDWRGFQVKSQKLVRGIDEYMGAAEQALQSFRGRRYEIVDCEIQLHGDVAIVFYLAHYGIESDSGESELALRSVDIYRRDAAGWNQCGSNICVVPE